MNSIRLTCAAALLLLLCCACGGNAAKPPYKIPHVLSEEALALDGQEYAVQLVQTVYERVPGSEEDGFRLYIGYKGMFDAVVLDASGTEVSRLTGEELFLGDPMSLLGPGTVPIVFRDYNGDGDPDFVIGDFSSEEGVVKCAILSVSKTGQLRQLHCEGFLTSLFAYTSNTMSFNGEFHLLEGDEPGFETWIYWDIRGQYVWDGELFRFSLQDPEPAPGPDPFIPGERVRASLADWADFRDETGELVDFESDDVKSINTRYAVGWTLDDPKPRKIYQDDIISGLRVSWAESHYYIDYSIWGDPPYIFSYQSGLDLDGLNGQSITLSGLARRQTDGYGNESILFYPYKDENGSNLPILLPYGEWWHDDFKELSSVQVNDDTVIEVQPVGISVENVIYPDTGDIFDVTMRFDSLSILTLTQGEMVPPHDMSAFTGYYGTSEIVSIETLR
jgi:hypothetical protein